MRAGRRRVLLTGATGYVAGQLLPALRERYDLTLVDVRAQDRDGRPVDGVEVLDLLDDPDDRLVELCADVDVIVHCGFRRPTGTPTYAAERATARQSARS